MKNEQQLAEMAEEYANSIDFTQTKNLRMIIAKAYIKGYQAAQEEMKWIDCKDRLPEIDKQETYNDIDFFASDYVLASIEGDKLPRVLRIEKVSKEFTNCNWYCPIIDDILDFEDKITHWMPLPQKPLMP